MQKMPGKIPHCLQNNPWIVANSIGILPVLTVSFCAWYSMRHGLAPSCNPLIEGCLSISAACRSVPVIYLFRAIMLPCTLLLIAFWLLNNQWLANRGHHRLGGPILWCGVTGAVFLVLYVLFLGTDGPTYRFLRRFGVYVFFAGTAIAQLLTVIASNAEKASKIIIAQRILVYGMLIMGPLNLVQKAILANPDSIENMIEWYFGLFLCLFFILSGAAWRQTSQSPS